MASKIELDLNSSSAASVQKTLLTLQSTPECEVIVRPSTPIHYALNGLRMLGRLRVEGDIGDFCAMAFGEAEGLFAGSVGNYFAHSLHSGMITVHGTAKDSLCPLGISGLLAVYGSAGDRTAVALQGADVIVRGSIGALGGLGMRSGTLIVGGNAGRELGKGMIGGTIYLRGDAESLSPNIEEVRTKESDKLKIGLLMLKAGIKVTGKEFKVYRAAG